MKITRRLANLTAGTMIECNTGIIILISGYISYLDAYAYVDTEITEDGEVIALDDMDYYVTPSDLIGGEIL